MTLFSKDSPPNISTPSVAEQLRMQRLLEQESRSSTSDTAAEESDSLHSFTAASAQLRMQRQLQQESRSSEPNNEEGDSFPPIGLSSFTAAPRGSYRTSLSMDNLRSILARAIEVLDEDDEAYSTK
jgi:hypothetical protein